ncbi:hypothetical protein [Bacteroides sp.]
MRHLSVYLLFYGKQFFESQCNFNVSSVFGLLPYHSPGGIRYDPDDGT